jgi:hypothetical protein
MKQAVLVGPTALPIARFDPDGFDQNETHFPL